MSLPVCRCSRGFLLALAWPVWAGSGVHGIKNFYQVDQHVYRGGQPSVAGFRYLAQIGVKTVIDLREADARSKKEERVVAAAGMQYVSVPMTGLTPPTEAEITRILGILEDENTGAVFVHCQRGADRTGAIIASYRIDHDRWDNAQALREAKALGMSFFQLPRQSFIRTFQRREAVAAAAPLTGPASNAMTADPRGAASPAPAGLK